MAEIKNPFRRLPFSRRPATKNEIQKENEDLFVKRGIMKVSQGTKHRSAAANFVLLHQDCYNFSAQLTIFENEKKYRLRSAPQYEIQLKNVCNVNRTVHSKIPFCMALFTMKDTWHLGCDTQEEMESWFNAIFNVYCGTQGLEQDVILRGNFDYVWDVTVLCKNLVLTCPEIAGEHRFCLNVHSFYLYKIGDWKPLAEFPLVCISEYGVCKQKLFSVTLGRSAAQGPGNILFKLSDPLWSQNMHDIFKKILDENHALRVRSSSNASSIKTSSSACVDQIALENSKFDSGVINGSSMRPRTRSTVDGHNAVRNLQQHLSNLKMRSRGKGVMPSDYPGGSSDRILSGSTSAASTDSSRTSRYVTDTVNHLPVLKENGNSGSGGEILPVENIKEIRRDAIESGSEPYAPMNASSIVSLTTHSSDWSYNLEEVQSYVSDVSFGSAFKPPDRAYSLGSKPPGPTPAGVATSSALIGEGGCAGSSKFGAGRLLEVKATIETENGRRPRANSFGNWQGRGQRQSAGPLSQRFYDSRTSIGSQGSFGSTGRRLTGSSYRSNFSEDLVEMDFGASCSARTASMSSGGAGRSPSNASVASSSDSLTATAAVAGFNGNNRPSRGGSSGSGARVGGPSQHFSAGQGPRTSADSMSPAARLVADCLTADRGDYIAMEAGPSSRSEEGPEGSMGGGRFSDGSCGNYVPMELGARCDSRKVPSSHEVCLSTESSVQYSDGKKFCDSAGKAADPSPHREHPLAPLTPDKPRVPENSPVAEPPQFVRCSNHGECDDYVVIGTKETTQNHNDASDGANSHRDRYSNEPEFSAYVSMGAAADPSPRARPLSSRTTRTPCDTPNVNQSLWKPRLNEVACVDYISISASPSPHARRSMAPLIEEPPRTLGSTSFGNESPRTRFQQQVDSIR